MNLKQRRIALKYGYQNLNTTHVSKSTYAHSIDKSPKDISTYHARFLSDKLVFVLRGGGHGMR